MSSRLRVALLTPLPPAQTGTADYAAALIPELEKRVALEVFRRPPPRARLHDFDAVIYQIANNPHHAPFYQLALEYPGIVVLHEANLHDLVKGLTLNSGTSQAYLSEVLYEIFCGESGQPQQRASVDIPQPRTFTILRRLLDGSQACIVHSAYTERQVRLKGYCQPVAVIPHGAEVQRLDGSRQRQALGLGPDDWLLGIFGYQRPDKRTLTCLRAFRELSRTHPEARLIVVGQPHPEVPIAEWLSEMGLHDRVCMLGYQSLEDFDGYLAACDIVLNLRHPSFGETSGTMMRAFGLGKAVIVSETGACCELPNDICMRVEADVYEERILLACLSWLLNDRAMVRAIGARAQQWIGENCTWAAVAERYAEVSRAVAQGSNIDSRPSTILRRQPDARDLEPQIRRWIKPASEAEQYYRIHYRRLVRTVQLIPSGRGDDRILEMGCYLQITPLLQSFLGYGEVRGCALGGSGQTTRARAVANDGEIFECDLDLFNAETDLFPYPDGYFATVVCGELLEHLQRDPMHMMFQIHRVLKPGGILVLTTPNAASLRAIDAVIRGSHPASFSRYGRVKLGGVVEPGHSREYTPDEMRLLLEESGFVPVSIETGPYGDPQPGENPQWVVPWLKKLGYSTGLRDDCIYAVGCRQPLTRKRFPQWLYG